MLDARESRALLQDDQEVPDLENYMPQAAQLMREECISLLVPLMIFDVPLFNDPTKVSLASDNVYTSLHDFCCTVFAKSTNPYLMRKPRVFTAMRGRSKNEVVVHRIVKAMTIVRLSKAANNWFTNTSSLVEGSVCHIGILSFYLF
jgi:hypothetical protein